MSELRAADGKSICALHGLRISHASRAEGASFTAFLSHDAALQLSVEFPRAPMLDSDDGTRYRATIHAVTIDQHSNNSALASIRGTVLQLL